MGLHRGLRPVVPAAHRRSGDHSDSEGHADHCDGHGVGRGSHRCSTGLPVTGRLCRGRGQGASAPHAGHVHRCHSSMSDPFHRQGPPEPLPTAQQRAPDAGRRLRPRLATPLAVQPRRPAAGSPDRAPGPGLATAPPALATTGPRPATPGRSGARRGSAQNATSGSSTTDQRNPPPLPRRAPDRRPGRCTSPSRSTRAPGPRRRRPRRDHGPDPLGGDDLGEPVTGGGDDGEPGPQVVEHAGAERVRRLEVLEMQAHARRRLRAGSSDDRRTRPSPR